MNLITYLINYYRLLLSLSRITTTGSISVYNYRILFSSSSVSTIRLFTRPVRIVSEVDTERHELRTVHGTVAYHPSHVPAGGEWTVPRILHVPSEHE